MLTNQCLTNLLKLLFENEPLWEKRPERTAYRNSPFYTVGAPIYLDLNSEADYPNYTQKVAYFNNVTSAFTSEMGEIFLAVDWNFRLLSGVSKPGFHIFPPHPTSQYFFGKFHEDRQWGVFPKLPEIPNDWLSSLTAESHFSFTYVLKLPQAGGGLYIGDKNNYYPYEQNALYVHSGQFLHAIAPTPGPVLPCDWRITLQGHGFKLDGNTYLYW